MKPTDREVEVLAAYLSHGSTKDAADLLGLRQQTVKNHLVNLYERLDVGGAIEAALALGWLRVPDHYTPCGWIGMCTRPMDHRGHHGGWTGVGQGRER
jgi:DNA-binding CsgD family transcriptional regulator